VILHDASTSSWHIFPLKLLAIPLVPHTKSLTFELYFRPLLHYLFHFLNRRIALLVILYISRILFSAYFLVLGTNIQGESFKFFRVATNRFIATGTIQSFVRYWVQILANTCISTSVATKTLPQYLWPYANFANWTVPGTGDLVWPRMI